MAKSYSNPIVAGETSLAIEVLLIHPTTYDYTAVATYIADPSNTVLAAGAFSNLTNLGAVVEDSPSLTIRREKFQLKTGVPKALQYEASMGLDGEFTISLYGKSNSIVRYALGVTEPVSIEDFGTRIPFGGTSINKYSIIGLADFLDGSQVQHVFPEVTVKAEYTENIRPDDVGKITLGFDAYSYISTFHNDERVVGERYYFTYAQTY